MENFETLSVEQIFITEMARTALKSSHLSSLVNIKSAFLPVRSGLTKSFAEDQRILHHALVWQWEGSTQTLLSHRQYFFNFLIRNIRDISTLMITRVAANFQGILINVFGKHKERGDPTFSLRYEWKDASWASALKVPGWSLVWNELLIKEIPILVPMATPLVCLK